MGWLKNLLGSWVRRPKAGPPSLPAPPPPKRPPPPIYGTTIYGTTTGRVQCKKPNLANVGRMRPLSPGIYTQEIDLREYASSLNDYTVYVRAILDVHSSFYAGQRPRYVTVVMDNAAYVAMPKHYNSGGDEGYANLHLLIKDDPAGRRTLCRASIASVGPLGAKLKRPDLHLDAVRVTFSCSYIRRVKDGLALKPLGRFSKMWI